MLREEHSVRTAPETQALYTAAESTGASDWMEVTAELQDKLVQRYGFIDPWRKEIALNELRRATYNFPDDAEIQSIPLYVKFNKARQGNLRVGDKCPDMSLLSFQSPDVAAGADASGGGADSGCGAGAAAGAAGSAAGGAGGPAATTALPSGAACAGIGPVPTVSDLQWTSLLTGPHRELKLDGSRRPLVIYAGSYS